MPIGLPAVFLAGLLTFGSPCVLPLVPVYLSLLTGASVAELRSGRGGTRRPVLLAAAFALGLAAVFTLLGVAATTVGGALAAHRVWLMRAGGAVTVLFGLRFLGVLRVPWLEREFRPGLDALSRRGGIAGAFLFGAAFALGWTPCIGPVLGAVLTYTASATSSRALGALYLATYAAGLALPLVAAAAVAPAALRALRRVGGHLRALEVATGALLVLAGGLLAADRLGALMPSASPAPATTAAAASAAPCERPVEGAVACGLPAGGGPSSGPAQRVPEGPAVVEFVSPGCPVCQRMAPVIAAAERRCGDARVRVTRVDVAAPGGRDLARRYAVPGVPTLVFLDRDGRDVARLVGEQPGAAVERSFEALAGRRCAARSTRPPDPDRGHACRGAC